MTTQLRIKYDIAGRADIGKKRSINQDSVKFWFENDIERGARGLLLVADGVGGQEHGEVASQLAVETAYKLLTPELEKANHLDEDWEKKINNAFQAANKAIIKYARKEKMDPKKVGTTMECVVMLTNRAYIGHVGDSRVYMLRRGGIEVVTEDHSAVMQLVNAGIIEPEDIYTHPHKNILIRGLGGEEDLEVDLLELSINVGERFMLCSDGLWGLVRDDRIENILLQAGSPELLVEELILEANDAGGEDNISVIVCDILPG